MEQTVKCPSCGSENSAGQQFCGACGTKLGGEEQQQKITCPGCGSENLVGQQFCGACGAKLAGETEQKVVSEKQQDLDRVTEPPANRGQIEVKPTWGLAWGLYWRMLLLGLLIAGIGYLIAMVVMLAFGFTYPVGF